MARRDEASRVTSNAAPSAVTPGQPAESETRRERIATAAYYRAERRNFEGDAALDDWLEAEREIDSAAAAGGIQGEASRVEESDGYGTAAARGEGANREEADIIHPDDVQRWARELGVSAGSLRVAIERAGSRLSDVRRFLEEHDPHGR